MCMGWFLIVTIAGEHYWYFVIECRDATYSTIHGSLTQRKTVPYKMPIVSSFRVKTKIKKALKTKNSFNSIYIHKSNHSSTNGISDIVEGVCLLWWNFFYFYSFIKSIFSVKFISKLNPNLNLNLLFNKN